MHTRQVVLFHCHLGVVHKAKCVFGIKFTNKDLY